MTTYDRSCSHNGRVSLTLALSALFLQSPSCSVAHALAPSATSSQLCSTSFEHDRAFPVHVDNEANACLDLVALDLKQKDDKRVVIVGHYSTDEKPKIGAQRAANLKLYLVEEQGIASGRIEARYGGSKRERSASIYMLPNRAGFTQEAGTRAIPKDVMPTR